VSSFWALTTIYCIVERSPAEIVPLVKAPWMLRSRPRQREAEHHLYTFGVIVALAHDTSTIANRRPAPIAVCRVAHNQTV
jgi:hypothetical protein